MADGWRSMRTELLNEGRWEEVRKGPPARESRTGTRLVSPATGKKNTSGTGPRNAKLSTLEILLTSTDTMESGTTPGKPLKPESEWKKHILEWLSIFGLTGGSSNGNRNSGGIGTVEAQKGSTKTCRCTEWVSMRASPRQFIERGTRVQTTWLRDSVGKYRVLWALMNFLTQFIYLVSSPMCRTWAGATELGVRRLWGIWARTRREAPTTMRSYYYI